MVICSLYIILKQKHGKDEEEVSSYYMTLRKREEVGN
jgi:hypothetical protein